MDTSRIINIEGYDAGKNGNLLVCLDSKLVQDLAWNCRGFFGGENMQSVAEIITTAKVVNPAQQQWLADKFTDGSVDTSKIIVVSDEFMKREWLWKKRRNILLYRENLIEVYRPKATSRHEAESYANILTMVKFGKWKSTRAFDWVREFREDSERAIVKPYKRYLKHSGSNQAQEAGMDGNQLAFQVKGPNGEEISFTQEDMERAAQEIDKLLNDGADSDSKIITIQPES